MLYWCDGMVKKSIPSPFVFCAGITEVTIRNRYKEGAKKLELGMGVVS